jgi:hypothetical protein
MTSQSDKIPSIRSGYPYAIIDGSTKCAVNKSLRHCDAFEPRFQIDRCYHRPQNPKWGLGDNTMRHRAVPAATMIVAAGLIGITQARLPRPVRDYRDRVAVEMSAFALHDTIARA